MTVINGRGAVGGMRMVGETEVLGENLPKYPEN
jgi:hypothetical protein